jgi:hypothetical protein
MSLRQLARGLRQLPHTYAALAVLMLLAPLVKLAHGGTIHASVVEWIVFGLLLLGLTRRWLGSWVPLLAWNGLYIVASLALRPSPGPTIGLPHDGLLFALCVLCLGLVLSPSMRQYIGIRRRTPGPRAAG